jgi:hypothetical protein
MKTLSKLTLTLCFILSSFCFQLQKSYAYCITGLYANMCSTPGNTFISNVSLVGKNLSNSSGCTGITGPGVNVYLATGNYTDTLQQGLTYTLSITTAQSSVIVYWIDFNQNNLFDAYEFTSVTSASTANVASLSNFTVPYTCVGALSIRIRVRNSNIQTDSSEACANWYSGELEQYQFTVLPAPACTAVPAAGIAVSSLDTVCSNTLFTLSLQGAAIAQGLTQQWESSQDALTWTAIPNATAPTLSTAQLQSSYYRCQVTCAGSTSISGYKKVDMLPTEYYNFNGGTIFTEHFDTWMDGCDIHDIPSINWLSIPSTGDASWRRHDEGFTTANWSFPSPNNIVTPYLGNGCARFHSFSGWQLPGVLDLYLNCSNFSSINLDFWYFKKVVLSTGIITFEVQVSTNGGFSFGPALAAYGAANPVWVNKVISSIPVGNSPTVVLRLIDKGDWSGVSTDTGIDELRIDGILGTSANAQAVGTIQFYPNPSTGIVQLSCNNVKFKQAALQLLDISGRVVSNTSISNTTGNIQVTYDWSSFPKGIYFVKFNSDVESLVQKIILE